MDAAQTGATAPLPGPDALVIVGAGLAGWTVARELRQRDKERSITLICADQGHFYAKPMPVSYTHLTLPTIYSV